MERQGFARRAAAPAAEALEAGGGELEKEARAKAPFAAGTAVSIGPGELAAGNVILAAIKDDSGAVTGESVTRALAAALAEAEELEAETVAVPALGLAEGGIGAEESAAAVISALEAHEGESVTKVLLVDTSETAVEAFTGELERRDDQE